MTSSLEIPEALTSEEAKMLVSLCYQGKLYEIEKWISSGKSLHVPRECKRAPLQIALDQGFHSLVELLARNDVGQNAKNEALADAVSKRHLEFVQLLFRHRAEIFTVPFSQVLLSWDPTIIRFFLDHGADFISGSPFAEAFGARIRTALRPFMECKQMHPELAPQLQDQADSALRYFCREGNLKWISLMLWVGANPRAAGPKLGDEEDPEYATTALREACYSKDVEVLKKLKPQSDRDDLSELLRCAAMLCRSDSVQYLLELGANPNNKPNGGSSALDSCLWHLNVEHAGAFFSKRQKSIYDVGRTLDLLRTLVEHGALWKPDSGSGLSDLRRTLYQCEPTVTVELIRILKKHDSCTEDTIQELFRTPRMRQHLASQESKLPRWPNKKEIRNGTKNGKSRWPSTKRELSPAPTPSYALLRKYNRQTLYDEIWAQPMLEVAKKYEISDVGLSKVCRKFGIPVPGRGYWAKKSAGRPVRKRPPLDPLTKDA
jgi:Ankyrin repeats (many copies)